MDVELATNASFGSISRLESGKVNPTKETIEKISRYLNLSDREIDYLIGITSNPASIEECQNALKSVDKYFSNRAVIAYLVDDRFRLLKFSESLKKILKISKNDFEKIFGKTLIELILDPKYGLKKYFSKNFSTNLTLIITRFFVEMGHMIDDAAYQHQFNLIKSDTTAYKVWNLLSKSNQIDVFGYADRQISFTIGGHSFNLNYSNEPLPNNKRFTIVEYLPTSSLNKLLAKFLL